MNIFSKKKGDMMNLIDKLTKEVNATEPEDKQLISMWVYHKISWDIAVNGFNETVKHYDQTEHLVETARDLMLLKIKTKWDKVIKQLDEKFPQKKW